MTEAISTLETLGIGLNKSRFLALKDLLPWFEADYKLDELVNDFWGLKADASLIAVTKDIDDKHWRGLVSEWDSFGEQAGQFRLNKDFVANVLNISLGTQASSAFAAKHFELKDLTELELSIFENFFVELENFWKEYWAVTEPHSSGTFNYLIWALEFDNHEVGYLSIAVPPGLSPKRTRQKAGAIGFDVLINELDIKVPVDLSVGKTCLSIKDIKNLERDDVILFEDSNINNILWANSELQETKVNIDLPDRNNPRWSRIYYDSLDELMDDK